MCPVGAILVSYTCRTLPQKALLISLSLGLGDSAGALTAPQCMVAVVVDRGVHRDIASLSYSM